MQDIIIRDMSNSPLCMGANFVLPSAKLLSLGTMQTGLSFVLAKPQFCLCSLSCEVSVLIVFDVIEYVQKYAKFVWFQKECWLSQIMLLMYVLGFKVLN